MAEALTRLWAEVRELGLGSSGELDYLDSAPSPLQFLRDHVSPNKPCIISRSATAHWPAVARSLWEDDDYLCDTLRSHTVSVHLTPNGRADSVIPLPKSGSESEEELLCFATPCVQQMRFPEALRLISSPSSSLASVAYAQQQNDCFRGEYSDLAADVEPHIPWATEAFNCLPEAINLWIGNSQSQTSFHKDHYENLYVVITGEKHFLLLPPTDLHRLYIRPYPAARYIVSPEKSELILELESPERQVPWCSVDPFPSSPEAMAGQMTSFPLYFNGPKPFECTIKAGEILYLPSMWFHHVRQTPDRNGRTIAINYWYDMQFDIKYAYFNFLQSFNLCPATYSMTSSINSEVDEQSSLASTLLLALHEDNSCCELDLWNIFAVPIRCTLDNALACAHNVVALFTEELVFRACMIPLLLCSRFQTQTIIIIGPVFLSSGLKLQYIVVIRTGNVISAVIALIFCNVMGLLLLLSPRTRG